MALQVIGAGFGRTGTNSLKLALEHLGFGPCHHMKEVFPRINQIQWFEQAANGKEPDWDKVFAHFEASVDWPSCTYFETLAKHYPDAKVILSVRDPQRWYDSVRETIYPASTQVPRWMKSMSSRLRLQESMVMKTIWSGTFQDRFEDRDHAIGVYQQHIENVKSKIPADRLLIHEATQGWEPLCEFLGKSVPNQPYPKVNEAKVIKRLVSSYKWLNWAPWFLLAIILWAGIAKLDFL
jgi:hypothetical protein